VAALLPPSRSVPRATRRVKIRELMVSGARPGVASGPEPSTSRQTMRVKRVISGRLTLELCLICGASDPIVAYLYPDSRVVPLHAACGRCGSRSAREREQLRASYVSRAVINQ
jgi:hypothetical protein